MKTRTLTPAEMEEYYRQDKIKNPARYDPEVWTQAHEARQRQENQPPNPYKPPQAKP